MFSLDDLFEFGRELKSIDENRLTAELIYREVEGDIIATSFSENPLDFLDYDLAKNITYKERFTRMISSLYVDIYKRPFYTEFPDSNLISLKPENYSGLNDGIFGKDDSKGYFAFFASGEKENRKGNFVVGEDAKRMYEKYRSLI